MKVANTILKQTYLSTAVPLKKLCDTYIHELIVVVQVSKFVKINS